MKTRLTTFLRAGRAGGPAGHCPRRHSSRRGRCQLNLVSVKAKGGALATITVKNSLPGAGFRGFVTFDLSALPMGSQIEIATLRAWVNYVTREGTVDVLAVLEPWSEATVTTGTAPTMAANPSGTLGVTKTKVKNYVSADVTKLMQDWLAERPSQQWRRPGRRNRRRLRQVRHQGEHGDQQRDRAGGSRLRRSGGPDRDRRGRRVWWDRRRTRGAAGTGRQASIGSTATKSGPGTCGTSGPVGCGRRPVRRSDGRDDGDGDSKDRDDEPTGTLGSAATGGATASEAGRPCYRLSVGGSAVVGMARRHAGTSECPGTRGRCSSMSHVDYHTHGRDSTRSACVAGPTKFPCDLELQ